MLQRMTRTSSPRHLSRGLVVGVTVLTIAGASPAVYAVTSGISLSSAQGRASSPAAGPKKGKKSGQSGKSAGSAKNGKVTGAVQLPVPGGLSRKLGDLYYRHVRNQPDVRRKDVVGPIHIHYGKVTQKGKPRVVFYAIGDTALFGELFNPKLLPHVWRKMGTDGKWQYVGATPKGLCAPGRVPRRLANAWKVKCN